MLKGTLLGVLVQLECKSPTEDEEEAIFNFVKGPDVFVSLSAGQQNHSSTERWIESWGHLSGQKRQGEAL